MKPIDKFKEIREKVEAMSQEKFAHHLNTKKSTVNNIEMGLSGINDDIALRLEALYKVPFKWWKTGEGKPYFEGNTYELTRRDLTNAHKNVRQNLIYLEKKNNLSSERMAEILGYTLAEYDKILTSTNLEPTFRLGKAVVSNFNVQLNDFYFGLLTDNALQSDPHSEGFIDNFTKSERKQFKEYLSRISELL